MFKNTSFFTLWLFVLALSGCATKHAVVEKGAAVAKTQSSAPRVAVIGLALYEPGSDVADLTRSVRHVLTPGGVSLDGAGVGHSMGYQQKALEREIAKGHRLEIERTRDNSLILSLDSEISFGFDSTRIKSSFMPTLGKLAGVMRKFDKTAVHVIGHADNTGPGDYNQRLSERRAERVARFLGDHGVALNRLRTEGRGETEPKDTNATKTGRQSNRRVEIHIKPVVEGEENWAYEN